MKNIIKQYFSFNKRERSGIFFLIFIIFILIITNYLLPFFSQNKQIDFSEFDKEISVFETSQKAIQDSIKKAYSQKTFNYKKQKTIITKNKLTPFKFNPNDLSIEKWKELGLTENQIKVIKNYEKRGGKFYKKEDLKKIYSISKEEYKILEPFIVIPEIKKSKPEPEPEQKKIKQKSKYNPATKTKPLIIELNSVDSIQLIKLPGIGPVFSQRIIKYRDLLGGFSSSEQLLEVYGFDSSRYFNILPFLKIDTASIKKLNINSASFKELLKHPYISFDFTKYIVNTRKKEKFSTFEQLKHTDYLTDSLYFRLLPYLELE
jgi:DNA uptake protein ComE-like DNA-binding protein